MSGSNVLRVVLVVLWLAASAAGFAGDAEQPAPSELLVKFKESVRPGARYRRHKLLGARRVRRAYRGNFEIASFPQAQVDRALEQYLNDPDVQYAEPNYPRRALWTPNEPVWWRLWNLHQINVEEAWDYSFGEGVVVALVDSGITPGGNDGFLYALVPGYNFVSNNSNTADDNSHGTFVAGTIAQRTNNAFGSAGVAPRARLMPVKVLNRYGTGRVSAIASGIRWAADHGARVINISLGGRAGSLTESSAVSYAYSRGCVIAAAAGNDGSRLRIDYPAAYSRCIAVGATQYDQSRARYSNYGSALDLMAPGGNTSLDQNGDGFDDGIFQESAFGDPGSPSFEFDYWQGTSLSAPHVSGLAALLLSVHPAWTNAQVRQRIESTCVDLGRAGKDREYGYGLIDAGAALAP